MSRAPKHALQRGALAIDSGRAAELGHDDGGNKLCGTDRTDMHVHDVSGVRQSPLVAEKPLSAAPAACVLAIPEQAPCCKVLCLGTLSHKLHGHAPAFCQLQHLRQQKTMNF
jgi:hypothetical protein